MVVSLRIGYGCFFTRQEQICGMPLVKRHLVSPLDHAESGLSDGSSAAELLGDRNMDCMIGVLQQIGKILLVEIIQQALADSGIYVPRNHLEQPNLRRMPYLYIPSRVYAKYRVWDTERRSARLLNEGVNVFLLWIHKITPRLYHFVIDM